MSRTTPLERYRISRISAHIDRGRPPRGAHPCSIQWCPHKIGECTTAPRDGLYEQDRTRQSPITLPPPTFVSGRGLTNISPTTASIHRDLPDTSISPSMSMSAACWWLGFCSVAVYCACPGVQPQSGRPVAPDEQYGLPRYRPSSSRWLAPAHRFRSLRGEYRGHWLPR